MGLNQWRPQHLPLSKGDRGSLSSRSSAEDMVPVEGVRGSLLLKSPEQDHMHQLILMARLHSSV